MSKEIFAAPRELKGGLTGAELEKFWVEEYLPNKTELRSYRVPLNKGTFDKRLDRHLYIGHFESSECVTELFPVPSSGIGSL